MRRVLLELLRLIFYKLLMWKDSIIFLAKRGYFKKKVTINTFGIIKG